MMLSLEFEPVRARTDQTRKNALESIFVASTVDTDVSAVEPGSYVLEFALERGSALA